MEFGSIRIDVAVSTYRRNEKLVVPTAFIETETSSFWRNYLHWKLTKWQLLMQQLTKISSSADISVSVLQHWRC